jgi:hypothetical protein
VFAFGNAPFEGSAGGLKLHAPVVGLAGTPDGRGYWMVGADGGVFTYGDAPFYGSPAGTSNEAYIGMMVQPYATGYTVIGALGNGTNF